MGKKLIFQPKARLLLQLGDQLIRNESIALIELVKNSYDAFATSVVVLMKKVDNQKEGEIVIIDNGIGMNADIIEKVWMQPGSDNKLKIIKSIINVDDNIRIPIGEKGIGRFGVHKLGYDIELVSKAEGSKEVFLKIDWTEFEKDDLLKNKKITLITRNAKVFTEGKTGTRIRINNLRHAWTRSEVRELHRAVISLSSPFGKIDKFKVNFKIDNQQWLTGLLKFEDIKKYALYYANVEILNSVIKKLAYEFRPWDVMTKLNSREILKENIRMVEQVTDDDTNKKKTVTLNLKDYNIGPIKLEILIFDLENKVLGLRDVDKKGLREYIRMNGGVRVYKGGVRVYDYGEPKNDWLDLDLMRVNQPGKTISNNIIIGAISLDRLKSSGLEEKTNREGFVENEAYRKFYLAIRFALDKILTERNTDKEKVRKFYSDKEAKIPVLGSLKVLQQKITKNIKDKDLKKDLIDSIKLVEKDYNTVKDIYIRSSSAGLSLSIVIHEVEKIVKELIKATENIPAHKHLKSLVNVLFKTINDYATIIKQSSKTNEILSDLLNQALSNIQFRLKSHKVNIINKFTSDFTKVKCPPNLVISTVINLIDNSIWWMNYAEVRNKQVYIDIINEPRGFISIIIADNGPGFTISTEDAVKPFISDKPGGMGLGLHLAQEVMASIGGRVLFPDSSDLKIPKEFKKGAILQLAFKK